jgi:hypothetical protein
LSVTLSGSTGPGAVVVVEVVVVEADGAGDVAAFAVEAWTRRRLSLLVEGPDGRSGVAVFVLVSAKGAEEAAGLALAAVAGGLVCAVTTVRAMKNAAPAQRKVCGRLGIDDVKLKNAVALISRKQTSPSAARGGGSKRNRQVLGRASG